MNLNIVLKGLQISNHLLFLYFLVGPYYSTSLLMLSFVVFYIITIIGVSAGLHRYFCHKSFKTTPFWENVMLWVSVPSTLGTPISWVGTHRMHHAFSDKDNDPHSPLILGFARSYLHIWSSTKIPTQMVSDIIRNKTAKFIHQNYLKLLFLYIAILYLIDPVVGIVFYSIPAMIMFHATGLINAVGHTMGYRNFETRDNSRNSLISSLLTAGEGLHNNHHGDPYSPKFSVNPNEIDVTWYFIKLIKREKHD